MAELDDDEADAGYRPPLPPDDRLWRHPSELDGHQASLWSRLRIAWRAKRHDTDAPA